MRATNRPGRREAPACPTRRPPGWPATPWARRCASPMTSTRGVCSLRSARSVRPRSARGRAAMSVPPRTAPTRRGAGSRTSFAVSKAISAARRGGPSRPRRDHCARVSSNVRLLRLIFRASGSTRPEAGGTGPDRGASSPKMGFRHGRAALPGPCPLHSRFARACGLSVFHPNSRFARACGLFSFSVRTLALLEHADLEWRRERRVPGSHHGDNRARALRRAVGQRRPDRRRRGEPA